MASIAPLSRLQRLLHRALEPSPHVLDPVLRQRARFLAGFSLAQAAMTACSAVTCWLTAPRELLPILLPVLAGFTPFAILLHALARSRHVHRTLWPAVMLQFWPQAAMAFLAPAETVNPLAAAGWLIPFLAVSSILLGARAMAFVALAVTPLLLVSLHRATQHAASAAWEAITLYSVGSVVTYLFARHHDAIEHARRATLLARNLELEELRASLEDRVEARTCELESRQGELLAANERLRAQQDALIQSEKLAVLGRLTAGIAHEMASPIAALLGVIDEVQALQGEYDRSIGDADVSPQDHRAISVEMAEALILGDTAANRLSLFVRKLKAQTRDAGPQAEEEFLVRAVVDESSALLAHATRASRVKVHLRDRCPGQTLRGVPSRLSQVVLNLLGNAVDATVERHKDRGGAVVVELSADAREVRISVQDHGPGIPDDVMPRLFEPLFTTKPHGLGTGLGLSIVEQIVRSDFGGRVEVANDPGGGAVFSVILPRSGESHGTQAAA